MDTDKLIYVGLKAFIARDGKILVLQDPQIGIDLPGGKIKEGEEIIEALKREVREETGLEIEVGEPFYAWLFKFIKPNPARKSDEVFLVGFRCAYKSGEVQLSDEHSSFMWIDKNSCRTLDDGSPHYKALEKYFVSNAE